MYQLLSQNNGINVSIPTLANPASSFTPPPSAVWVNGLWFLSLVISLTCALLATLLQQWARRYLRVTCPRYSPHKRARVRAFYAEGVEKLHLPWTVEMLPVLLHVSLFLFFAGLSVFLFSVDLTIFKVVTAWIALCVIAYAWITFLPIFHKNSPYTAPLSSPLSFCITGIRYAFFWVLERFTHINTAILRSYRSHELMPGRLDNFFSHSLRTTAEGFAFRMDPVIDYRALEWTFKSLDEDKELEKFFEGVPDFCKSHAIASRAEGFIKQNERMLSRALVSLMDRTLTSNLVSESVKQRRIIICSKVIEATSLLGPWYTLRRVLLGDWSGFLRSVEFGLFVLSLKDIPEVTSFYAKCVVTVIISSVQDRDERWLQLVIGQLKISKSVVRDYLAHRDSVLLATLIHICRQTVEACSGLEERRRSHVVDALPKTVESVCKLDHRCTSSQLQHDFCSLWNQLVDTAQDEKHAHASWLCVTILKNIRKVYIALHKGTDALPAAFAASDDRDLVLDEKGSYPKCTVGHHRSDRPVPPLHINEPACDAAGNSALTAAGSGPSVSFLTPVPAPAPFGAPHLGPYSPYPGTPYNMSSFPPASHPYSVPIQARQPVTPGFRPEIIAAGLGSDSGKDAYGLNPHPPPPLRICGEAMDHPRFDADSKLGQQVGPDMHAPSGSIPGLTSSSFQDNKSTQSTNSSEEEIGSSRDQKKAP